MATIRRRTTEELIKAALEADKKREKTSVKKEKDALLYKRLIEEQDPNVEIKEVLEEIRPTKRKDSEWDVRIGDPIPFFDPDLSYELTGYRPITATQGLDFDPKLFTEAADSFRKNGRYTMYMPGTFRNKLFWDQEWDRCKYGLTIGKYTLTGKNYFWLNYYRLESSISDKLTGEKLRVEDFPGFINKQYEYFHYLELCKKLKKDGLAFKSRGVNGLALY